MANYSNDDSNAIGSCWTESDVAGQRMNGEGSLYQRASGRWVGAVTLGYDTNGRPVRKTVTAKTKTEARQKLKDLQDTLDDGYTPPAREETLAQLFERWDRDVLSTQVQSDVRGNYMTVARCHITRRSERRRYPPSRSPDVQHLTAAKLRGGPDNVHSVSGGDLYEHVENPGMRAAMSKSPSWTI